MHYDSLCYSGGGGIFDSSSRDQQYKDSATLAIGIGGTGIAVLSSLKCKIYQQLLQDNPNEAIARYGGIQFLPIDSDITACDHPSGGYPLAPDEFFCTYAPFQDEKLRNRKAIEEDPFLNWLDLHRLMDRVPTTNLGGHPPDWQIPSLVQGE